MSSWFEDWSEWHEDPTWRGPSAAPSLITPVALDAWIDGIINISAGTQRFAFCVLYAENEDDPIPPFGTVTWGGQTIVVLRDGDVVDTDGGTGQCRMLVGGLPEAEIQAMVGNSIVTTGLTPDNILTGSYELVDQGIYISDECFNTDTTEPYNGFIDCVSSVTAASNEPIVACGHTNRTNAVVNALAPEFLQRVNSQAALQTQTIAERPGGSPYTDIPLFEWDLNSPRKIIYSYVIKGSQEAISEILDNPDSVELGAGWEDVT